MIYSIVYLICLAIAAFVLYNLFQFAVSVHRLRKFRGPMPLPLIGNLYDPEAVVMIKYLSKMRKRYGNVFRFFGFNQGFLTVCEPSMIRQILTDTKTFPKGDIYNKGFAYIFGQGLVTSDGEKHKKDRAAFSRFFARSNTSKYCPMMNAKALEIFRERIESVCNKDTYTSIDAEHVFAPLALRVFSQFCSSADLFQANPERESKMCKLVSDASFLIGASMILGLPQMSLFPWTKKLDLMTSSLKVEIDMICDSRRAAVARGDDLPDDCVTLMIKDNLSEKDIMEHMVTLLCAGHDTTAYFSSYCVYLLAQYPEVQQKLRDEINAVLGDTQEITADHVSSMPYMKCVMQETVRLFSIIPNLSRYCAEDFEFKEFGVTIPKGTNVIIPMNLVNRNPDVWADPNTFNPDRFDGTEMTCAKKGFFPFGYGSRVCIGNSLAQLESSIFISHLLRSYSLQNDPKYKLSISSGISLTTVDHIRFNAKKL